jgi:hypothetical protein
MITLLLLLLLLKMLVLLLLLLRVSRRLRQHCICLLSAGRRHQLTVFSRLYLPTTHHGQVTVTLADIPSGCEFTVACYHMPCMFYAPKVMTLHAAWAAERAFQVAEGRPLVLTGDFNLKPGDPAYQLLTSGVVEDVTGLPSYPEHPGSDSKWTAGSKIKPLMSAYVKVNGREPVFTNWAHEPGKEPFVDCLDYLFSTEDMVREWAGR